MPTQLPSGRWRTRVRHPRTGKQLNARAVIGGPDTYATRDAAAAAEDEARRLLRTNARLGVSVREFWQDWTSDPLWMRPAASTNIHNAERTRGFVDAYGDLPLRSIGDEHVAAWLKGGRNLSTVEKLRAMFNDAASPAAGRLVDRNPFAKLRLPSSRGRRDLQPPDQVAIRSFVKLADELTPPSFAGFVDVAAHTGMRPGELDALRWSKIDFQAGTILVDEQWSAAAGEFTDPKHHYVRTVALTEPAKRRLLQLPHESEFVFTTLRGTHYRPSSRAHHWNRVRCAAGLGNVPLYLATRHHFAWYAWNVLGLDARDVALQLGHRDGGRLVRELYGHADAAIARDRIREAFRQAPPAVVPLAETR
jgi:integrase